MLCIIVTTAVEYLGRLQIEIRYEGLIVKRLINLSV